MIFLLILGLLLSGFGLLILVEGVVIPPLFNTFSIAHKTFLKKKFGDEDSIVIFRWFGIALIIIGILILNYFTNNDGYLIFFYLLGVYGVVNAGKFLFTKEGRAWVLKRWEENTFYGNKKEAESYDYLRFIELLFLGVASIVFSLAVMLKKFLP